jgi:hypothetical protein
MKLLLPQPIKDRIKAKCPKRRHRESFAVSDLQVPLKTFIEKELNSLSSRLYQIYKGFDKLSDRTLSFAFSEKADTDSGAEDNLRDLLCYFAYRVDWLKALAEIGMTEVEVVEWTNRVTGAKRDSDIIIAKRNVYVELITRKAALQINKDDVIVEIYDSWYELFNLIRNELKRLPVPHGELAEHFKKMLNAILRPHLTAHQAKFRTWFESARRNPKYQTLSPQEVQRKFPGYQVLMKSLAETNQALLKASEEFHNLR